MRILAAILLMVGLVACGGGQKHHPLPAQGNYKLGKPYQISGRWYYPEFDPSYDERGIASWYGEAFHGRPTANGEVFDRHLISAAHTTIPLPSMVEVTNLENGRRMVIRVNDRGPFHGNRIIDLSEAAARELGFHKQGLAEVRVRFLKLADDARGKRPVPVAAKPKSSDVIVGNFTASNNATRCRVDEHFVQVAAVSDAGRAQDLAAHVALLGPIWRETLRPAAGPLHRVRIGPLDDRREAFEVLSQLRRMGYHEAYVADCPTTPVRTS